MFAVRHFGLKIKITRYDILIYLVIVREANSLKNKISFFIAHRVYEYTLRRLFLAT
jgi:hypothetical protein